ncbi:MULTISPECIES: peptide chain release factor 2 [Commensalibacter]|uniref:Peptide chain release factor 2 n=1 Tax=Commensalibacter melissae TaxID=2070537 RepID=A0A318MWJ0_9PROT|nr:MULTISPECIES: peptide chain release factor 2 [Commensalibacter]MCT6842806.1 peptide chain release factor 2 [Commensalibacter sp.]MBH9969689.1 peptide chain release factor 2 [Commensalibacter sp. M0265]MBH9972370.1 peptide chain release factor 2 [Commensalibacter melissae]MBH9977415.1 peptide chain release factor 2 [Commensalibacter sp. M0266]MBH9992724.1 peptide chain release factor 2 [Commensalibacter sp. M0270]
MSAESDTLQQTIEQSLELLRRHLDWDTAKDRLAELNNRIEDPNLWDDAENAQKIMQERTGLANQIERVERLEQDCKENLDLIALAEQDNDMEIVQDALQQLQSMEKEVKRLELESLLSGEADRNDCYLEVNSGAGGTEAQDWAEMMLRMYTRWAEQHGYKVTMLESTEGEQAGIKSATLQISGINAYGWLKTEAGVHRLVRISPFDSAKRRHTSFASVWVYPVIDDSIDIEVNESDLKIDTYRASGAGGQHINKTESAIRITHVPTGIIVACQTDRSQHRNRATAMEMLKARLYELELKKREEEAAQTEANKTDIGWGHQIRSYVLAPYQLVKDLRTDVEKTNPDAVLDGDLDDFMAAALALRVGATRSEASAKAT